MSRPDWRGSNARAAATHRVLMFSAAGLPLGVPLEEMLRVQETDGMVPLPHPHPALRGVVDTREGVCPVYDLGALGGAAPSSLPDGKGGLVAMFPHPAGSVGLAVERLAGLADNVTALPETMQKRLLKALPPAIQPLVTGAATRDGQLFFFFSRDAFLGWVASAKTAGA